VNLCEIRVSPSLPSLDFCLNLELRTSREGGLAGLPGAIEEHGGSCPQVLQCFHYPLLNKSPEYDHISPLNSEIARNIRRHCALNSEIRRREMMKHS
jgi:hypothetical protein